MTITTASPSRGARQLFGEGVLDGRGAPTEHKTT
jgi:hypothetical protein